MPKLVVNVVLYNNTVVGGDNMSDREIKRYYVLLFAIITVVFSKYIISNAIASGAQLGINNNWISQNFAIRDLPLGTIIGLIVFSAPISLIICTIASIIYDRDEYIMIGLATSTIVYAVSALFINFATNSFDGRTSIVIYAYETPWKVLLVMLFLNAVHLCWALVLSKLSNNK